MDSIEEDINNLLVASDEEFSDIEPEVGNSCKIHCYSLSKD